MISIVNGQLNSFREWAKYHEDLKNRAAKGPASSSAAKPTKGTASTSAAKPDFQLMPAATVYQL